MSSTGQSLTFYNHFLSKNNCMKNFHILIVLLLSIAFLSSCGGKKEVKNENTTTSGYIKIAVDQTMQKVIQNEIDVFEGLYPAKIEPVYTTETEAIELLKKDSVRLIVTARKLTEGEMIFFEEKKFQPKNVRIAIDDRNKKCLSFIVVAGDFGIQYNCDKRILGVGTLDEKYVEDGIPGTNDNLNRVEYFKQKVLTRSSDDETEILRLIAAYFPKLMITEPLYATK